MIQVVLVIRAISLLIFIPWNILADCIEPSLYSLTLYLSFLLTYTNTQHISLINTVHIRLWPAFVYFNLFFLSFRRNFFLIFNFWFILTVGSLSLPIISLTVELDHLGYRCIGDWQPWRPVIPTFSLWFHFPSFIFFYLPVDYFVLHSFPLLCYIFFQ